MKGEQLSGMNFSHVDLDLQPLEREHIDGVRYYKIPDEEELIKMVSITSVTSHFNKEIFINWRKKVGMRRQIRSRKRLQPVEITCILLLNIT